MADEPQNPQQPEFSLESPEIQSMLGLLRALAPADVPDETVVRMLEHALTKQTADLDQVLASIMDPARIEQRPAWGLQYLSKTGKKHGPFLVYKTLSKAIHDPEYMSQWALTFGALTSPLLRAIFLLHGWQIGFVETKGPKPRLVVPGRR